MTEMVIFRQTDESRKVDTGDILVKTASKNSPCAWRASWHEEELNGEGASKTSLLLGVRNYSKACAETPAVFTNPALKL